MMAEQDGLRDWYRAFAGRMAANPDMGLVVMREAFEQFHTVAAEAPGVSFADEDAGGVPALWCIPSDGVADRVVLFFHGGGFVIGSPFSHRKLAAHLAAAAGVRVLAVDYRRTPHHPFPAQIDDAVTAYRWLLGRGIRPEHIATAGDSAGGNLATTVVLKLRDLGEPLPAAIAPLSPWYDMETKLPGLDANAATDAMVGRSLLQGLAVAFLGGASPRDPLANPLYADLSGLPPLFLSAGGHETLADNVTALAERAREAGVDVTVEITPGRQHVFQAAAGRHSDADASVAAIGAWLRKQLRLP
jgi:acetyl esterase/lipase